MAISQDETGVRDTADDGRLLRRFADGRDEGAFETLLARHGPMVLRVCRSALRDPDDAQDAFQATFLVLVRRAGSLRRGDSVGPWLYGVACRVSARWRADVARRRARDLKGARRADAVTESDEPADWWALHEELDRLPEKYRAPLVLCYLEGLTHELAADRLHWPVGTVRGRLSRARELLRGRLLRRGLAPTAGLLALATAPLDASVLPAGLARATAAMAARFAATGALPPSLALVGTIQADLGAAARGKALAIALGAGGLAGLIAVAYAIGTSPGGPAIDVPTPRGIPMPTAVVAPVTTSARPVFLVPPSVDGSQLIWGEPMAVTFSPDGEVAATANNDGHLYIHRAADGQNLALLHGTEAALHSVAFSPDGQRLATIDDDWKLQVWDLDRDGWDWNKHRITLTIEAMRTHLTRPAPVAGAAFSPDGRWLAVAGGGWLARRFPLPDGGWVSGKCVAVVEVFDAQTGELRWEQMPKDDWGTALAYAPDGKSLATGGLSGAWVWDAATGRPTAAISTAPDSVVALKYASDGGTLAIATSGAGRSRLMLWDAASGRILRELAGPSGKARALAFSPDGQSVAIAGTAKAGSPSEPGRPVGQRILYVTGGGEPIWDVEETAGEWRALDFAPDGTSLLVGGPETVEVINAKTGRASRTLGVVVPAGHLAAPSPPAPSNPGGPR